MRIRDGTPALRVVQMTRSAVADMRDLRRNVLGLLQLEGQLAAASAPSIALFSVLTLLLVLTGWILLVSALVAWIADNWLGLPATLLVVAVVVLAAAIPCVMLVKGRAGMLTFEAARRQFGGRHQERRPAKSTEQIRREIAALESRIAEEKQQLQSALHTTRAVVRDKLSSRRARTGLVVAAVAAGALAGLRARTLSRPNGGANRQ